MNIAMGIKLWLMGLVLCTFGYTAYIYLNWSSFHQLTSGQYVAKQLSFVEIHGQRTQPQITTRVNVDRTTVEIETQFQTKSCALVPTTLKFSYKQLFLAKYFQLDELLGLQVPSQCRYEVLQKIANLIGLGNANYDVVKAPELGEVCIRSKYIGVACFTREVKDGES
ncbi:hypothetical protein VCR15J2_470516 [Vibrio coralliirubri]|uniref:hypothetical protein n=1 Tax=Vibrio coralliirubri TaxID=1516159 RepID=UPI0006370924|nr:hypothetical protein [Vibrio coralliirubri]CDT67749.1 hypothetical protein VCR15J2_470516 [Vibrio coralliirubri]